MNSFPNISNMFNGFYIIFGIVSLLSIGIFVFVFLNIFSPKFRSKFVSQNLKAQKQVLDDNKDILQDISTTNADLENISFKKKMETVKEVFKTEEKKEFIYCQSCGKKNNKNAKFCQECGEKIKNGEDY